MCSKKSKYVLYGGDESEKHPRIPLGRQLIRSLQEYGTKQAQVHAVTGQILTYASLVDRSIRIAKSLRARGLKPGDVVAISSENCLEFLPPVIGAMFIGLTCATLNPLYTRRELEHALGISKPRLVFCSLVSYPLLSELCQHLAFELVVLAPAAQHAHTPLSSLLLLRSEPLVLSEHDPDTHVAAILCSSGTTGLPKGVMLTDSNLLTCMCRLRDPTFGYIAGNHVLLGLLPFFHAYAFISQILLLTSGSTTVVMPRFEERLFLELIQKHKVSLLMLVPPLLVFLAKHPIVSQYDLSSVKEIWCGAAPLSAEVQKAVAKRLGLQHIRQGYGMTETTLAVLLTPRDRQKLGSSGMLAPSMECKVVDLVTSEPLGPNQQGELCFRGPLIMKGYCGDVVSTAATFDSEGFLHTGDVGYYDEEGFFFIVDRVKELIKYNGFQVPPAELEALLLTHQAVQDAAVIGIPDEVAGELPMAFVVRQPGSSVSEAELVLFVAGQVSPQKRLSGGVRFIDSIPKTASGKILRRSLRALWSAKL